MIGAGFAEPFPITIGAFAAGTLFAAAAEALDVSASLLSVSLLALFECALSLNDVGVSEDVFAGACDVELGVEGEETAGAELETAAAGTGFVAACETALGALTDWEAALAGASGLALECPHWLHAA
jgi:hypothetical protein